MRLTPIEPAFPPKQEVWIYRCSCGSMVSKPRRDVSRGRIKSCGCLNSEMRLARSLKHGCATRALKSPEYRTWSAMLRRCYDRNFRDFEHYRGRGITVCDEWHKDFVRFARDMGEKPSSKHSLDRIDCDGNYSRQNCRWATWHEQRMNQRRMKARKETADD